jgi:hypothetical protein
MMHAKHIPTMTPSPFSVMLKNIFGLRTHFDAKIAVLLFSAFVGIIYYPKLALVAILFLAGWFLLSGCYSQNRPCLHIQKLFKYAFSRVSPGSYIPHIIFISALLVIFLREPLLITNPRFWAEDGGHYFKYIYSHNLVDSLTFRGEYFSFLSTLSALAGTRIVPLEYAPLPFQITWLGIVSSALAIIAWGKSPLWNTPIKKIIACSIVLFAPRSAEIWMNSVGAQFPAAIVAAFILCEPTEGASKFKKYAFRFLLGVVSLHGVIACLLLPLFWIKYFRNRNDKETAIQGLFLTVGAFIQLIAIISAENRAQRHLSFQIDVLGWVAAVRTFGMTFSNELGDYIYSAAGKIGYHTKSYTYYGYFFVSLWLGIISILAWRLRNSVGIYLLASYFLLFLFSFTFGIGDPTHRVFMIPDVGNRYFYAPAALFLLSVMASIQPNDDTILNKSSMASWSIIASLLLGLGITSGIDQYKEEKLKRDSWPLWKDEVANWRKNPDYILRLWPSNWKIRIPEKRSKKQVRMKNQN